MLILGRETTLPLELAVGQPWKDNQPVAPNPDEHLNTLLARIRVVHQIPRKALETGRERQKRRANWQPFKVGDPVWIYRPGLSQRLKQKLAIPYDSQPYCVVKLLNGLNAVVKKGPYTLTKVIHINNFLPIYKPVWGSRGFNHRKLMTTIRWRLKCELRWETQRTHSSGWRLLAEQGVPQLTTQFSLIWRKVNGLCKFATHSGWEGV